MSSWYPVQGGRTVGTRGSEGGPILQDEEHPDGARITLERPEWQGEPRPVCAITCGIYGWMAHTRFFASDTEGEQAFGEMKTSLEEILAMQPDANDPHLRAKMRDVVAAIAAFVERFP